MPDKPLLLRRATPQDAAAMVAILSDTFESTWRPNITAAAAEAYLAEDRGAAYVAEHGQDFRVAERDGEVVGLVHWRGDFIDAVHVRSGHARAGIGRRLMDHAEAEIAAAGFPAVRLETDTFNTASQNFYAARCYREAGRYPDEEWNSGLTTILFVKPLRWASRGMGLENARMDRIVLREAAAADAAAIAALHVASWRDAYASILDPDFLAGPIEADRFSLWDTRLRDAPSAPWVQIAQTEAGAMAGFICACPRADVRWGSLIDNLHVLPALRGRRIGEQLLCAAAAQLADRQVGGGLHLWVFEANEAGLRFYQRMGGRVVESDRSQIPAAGGKTVLRVHWETLQSVG